MFDFLKKKIKANKYTKDKVNKYTKDIDDCCLDVEYHRLLDKLDNDFSDELCCYENNICPNCGVVYNNKIKSSRMCKECKKKIFKYNIYLTNNNYLIGIDKIKSFNKIQEELKNINFYERLFKQDSYYINIKQRIQEKRKKGLTSPRDFAWSINNDLFNEYTRIAIKSYGNLLKSQDQIMDSFDTFDAFERANHYHGRFLTICEHQKKWNVYLSILLTYVYHDLSAISMFYTYNTIIRPNKIDIEQRMHIRLFRTYLLHNKITLEEIKDVFFRTTTNFFETFITKEDAWKMLERFLKREIPEFQEET